LTNINEYSSPPIFKPLTNSLSQGGDAYFASPEEEHDMKKTLIAGVGAIMLIGLPMSYAQQLSSTQPEGAREHHPRFSAEDMKAFTEARIAGLKAGLSLTSEQEKNWPAVEQALRGISQDRQARMAAFREHKSEDGLARLRARADALTQRAADLKKLADAAEPLYKQLTDDQKRRLHVLIRTTMAGHRGGRGGGWHRQG
jgi:zinc resistance-associated protein